MRNVNEIVMNKWEFREYMLAVCLIMSIWSSKVKCLDVLVWVWSACAVKGRNFHILEYEKIWINSNKCVFHLMNNGNDAFECVALCLRPLSDGLSSVSSLNVVRISFQGNISVGWVYRMYLDWLFFLCSGFSSFPPFSLANSFHWLIKYANESDVAVTVTVMLSEWRKIFHFSLISFTFSINSFPFFFCSFIFFDVLRSHLSSSLSILDSNILFCLVWCVSGISMYSHCHYCCCYCCCTILTIKLFITIYNVW